MYTIAQLHYTIAQLHNTAQLQKTNFGKNPRSLIEYLHFIFWSFHCCAVTQAVILFLWYSMSSSVIIRTGQIVFFDALNSLHAYQAYFNAFLDICWLFSKSTFSKDSFRKPIRVPNSFGSRSECRSWSGSKQFAKVISRRQKSPLARKELNINYFVYLCWRFTFQSTIFQ